MAAERIIGIDFGTSTSVIRVKRYQDGKPVGDSGKLDTKEVIFGNQPTVPTVIQRVGDATYYGQEALIPRKKAVTYGGFKINLESGDIESKKEACALTEEFFGYLSKVYKQQSNGGHLGETDDKERTVISYPVKWSEETKQFMRDAAAKAGFPHVEGMDEAQAAIHAVTLQNEEYLSKKGYLISGKPCTMLLIDMGAGTTDLVLCRYTPGDHPQNEVICTWPQRGETFFGGQEIERILADYIREKLPSEEAGMIMKKLSTGSFKGWKENVVSPALSRGEIAEDFGALESIIDILELDVDDYSISREDFESFAKGYLVGFPELVQGCLQKAGIKAEDVELAILTGGHSQWYFAKEMLCGGMPDICGTLLPKVKEDPERVIPVSRPQETVALGLVYSLMTAKVVSCTETKKIADANAKTEYGLDDEKVKNASFYMQIEKTWKSEGEIAAVYGMVKSGKINMGDSVMITRQGHLVATSRISRLADTDRELITASDGDKIGLRLQDVKFGVVQAGDVVRILDFAKVKKRILRNEEKENRVVDYYRKNAQSLVCGRANGGNLYITAIQSDGTVVSQDPIVKSWKNMKAVTSSINEVAVLGKDGTVHTTRKAKYASHIQSIQYRRGNHSGADLLLLSTDGVVKRKHTLLGQGGTKTESAQSYRNVMKFTGHVIAEMILMKDGTVVLIKEDREIPISNEWHSIVDIANSGGYECHFCGLRQDGHVICEGSNKYGQCNVNSWNDIVAISCEGSATIGLNKNGTVVATGKNDLGRCNVETWRNVVYIACDHYNTVGVRKDGTVSVAGVLPSAALNQWHDIIAAFPIGADESFGSAFSKKKTGIIGIMNTGQIICTSWLFTYIAKYKMVPDSIRTEILPWKLF